MTIKDPQQDPPSFEDPALARKRRIELRASRVNEEDDEGEAASSSKRRRKEDASIVETNKPLSSIRGIKKHSRYVPEVPMTKNELSAWRKEARRVRNRESAAASRKKTRERIEELEGEVSVLQSKYAAALARIVELENGSPVSFTPDKLRQDILATVSPANTPASTATVSPPLSPRESSFMLPTSMESSSRNNNCDSHSHSGTLGHYRHQQQQQQQPIDMISRPTAV